MVQHGAVTIYLQCVTPQPYFGGDRQIKERYNFSIETKQLISLGIFFKGTSYSNFLTDTYRTVFTPIAIFTLYLSTSLKLIFFIARKFYPRIVFKVPPLPIAICWESWVIAWSQKNLKSMLTLWCKFRKCIMSSRKVSFSHLLNIVSS